MGAMRLFLLICLFVASVSSVRKLYNIGDLRKTGYGKPPPRHGLQLLYWFTQNVNVDQLNNRIHLNFTPEDYGFHLSENTDRILPSLFSRQSYYEVGNLTYPGANALPAYVWRHYRNNNLPERNMDRLVIPLDEHGSPISRVYITSHNHNMNDFNLSDTYEIDPALILQIRETSCNDYDISGTTNYEEEDDKTEENGCLEFLTKTDYSSTSKKTDNPREKCSFDSQCYEYEGIRLDIKTTAQGYSKIIWENIPADLVKIFVQLYICQNTYSSDTNEVHKDCRGEINVNESSGALETSVPLNAGLQPRLGLVIPLYFSDIISKSVTYIRYGPEFDGANGVIPIRIKGVDSKLQLYAKDGKACARLYIKKTFSNWKDVFYYSWIGFYKSSQDKNDDYSTYQYAVKFARIEKTTIKSYDIYEYVSSLAIAPEVQIRFLLDKKYNKVLAQTTPWESDEKVTSVCDKGNPISSSSWCYPEFFYQPEFYDANNVLPIKILTYNAGLQLFTKDGKACARLYIDKTFSDWKNTFYYSWVGFYTSSQNANEMYDTYQYAVQFKKIEDATENFDVYQYKSNLDIAPGVQIRFMKDKWYDQISVETEPWKSG